MFIHFWCDQVPFQNQNPLDRQSVAPPVRLNRRPSGWLPSLCGTQSSEGRCQCRCCSSWLLLRLWPPFCTCHNWIWINSSIDNSIALTDLPRMGLGPVNIYSKLLGNLFSNWREHFRLILVLLHRADLIHPFQILSKCKPSLRNGPIMLYDIWKR